ncbi:hypothetical protein [Aquidulcibacter sp.]|uniref:hypothetical protein n=1 Tax=Aquidulcibacter sp. TaxID=2052990 RepID=UPI0025BC840C|nr:hypothetical protein [Aquidulcibacter sp.]MCA3064454.1 hypothetical protein [Rhodocyclaceae bacterium]MCA3694269.1 hypothetical protein [Aquidulcibacter sp.]
MTQAAISAVRRQVREMVDGTLEIKLHVEPKDKANFHRLFPEIDMPVALAPLNPQFDKPQIPAEPEKDKPGPLCMLAVQWCKDRKFQEWLADRWGDEYAGGTDELNTKIRLCLVVEIVSRLQLDGDEQAANRFQTLIRLPYMKYQTTGVIE